VSDESDWDHWIDKIADEGVNLTKWEQEFVESVDEQRTSGRRLSERQAEILERIYSEKTP
jgi:hypothetical protein